MAILSSEYEQIMKEYFDVTDRDTRKILLNVNESDQNQVLGALTGRLYDHIIQKIDDIDFGTIDLSKGDVTKIEKYEDLVDSLEVMKKLLTEYDQKFNPVDIVIEALDNIRSRREMFEKAFKLNIELPMVTYCTMVLSVIEANAYLISTCVEFIKTPGGEDYEAVYNKVSLMKTKDSLVIKNLERFNNTCKDGKFDKAMEYVISEGAKNITGFAIGAAGVGPGGAAVIGITCLTILALNILPMLRELVYFFFYTRTQISDYFALQSELLKYNATNVEMSGMKDKKKIAKKQFKIAGTLERISNKISIDNKATSNKVEKEVNKVESKKYKTSELMDSVPDSATSSIF